MNLNLYLDNLLLISQNGHIYDKLSCYLYSKRSILKMYVETYETSS